MPDQTSIVTSFDAVQRAFSRQAVSYDEADQSNPIILAWREQVYRHVERFLKPAQSILELNAGTGTDALHFAKTGHRVHATDVSPGMIGQIKRKTDDFNVQDRLTSQLCSYDRLDEIHHSKFDYVFSNFGGLNCTDDLRRVTRHLPGLLNNNSFVTWVVMPRICMWELKWFFQGHPKAAFRRFSRNGTPATVEGEVFDTYYHSLHTVRKAFGKDFTLVSVEGLGALSPPPSSVGFVKRNPGLTRVLNYLDKALGKYFPFNRWADHLIITLQYNPE